MSPMTEEYAKLSLRVGVLAGAVDDYLGGNSFEVVIRFNAWSLTEQLLVDLESAARSLGVPDEVIQQAREMADRVWGDRSAVSRLMAIQSVVDARAERREG